MGRDRLNIVHVALGLGTGGLEKLLVEFARHADRDRFGLRFVALGGRGHPASEIEACGWPVTTLGVPHGRRPATVLRLAWLLRRWRPEVVHTHNNGPLIHAAPAAWLAGVPRVMHTRHHGHDPQPTRHEVKAFRLATRLVDRVVCVSRDAAAQSAGDGVAPWKLRTIHNGIDLARFPYAGPRAGGPAVTIARLSPEKDLPSLLRAVALVARAAPDFRLEVAGDGPSRAELERLAHELGLDARVRFLGEVRDVPALLARASLFVLPSLTEGISITLLEAMARGLPAVATRVGGNPEVVLDGKTGRLVSPGDPAELAQALLQLQGNPGQGHQMGLAARGRVERHFDVRRMVSEYEALYLEVAGQRAPRHAVSAEHGTVPVTDRHG